MNQTTQQVLEEWLNTTFRDAIKNDKARIRDAVVMLEVGYEDGRSTERIVQAVITSFVMGLILKQQPFTVSPENN